MTTLVIGLTGGIGTGKSEVARLLRAFGAVVINADQVGHEAYAPNSESWQDVVRTFGKGTLQPNGEIDRRKLGEIVFSDPGQLAKLNEIMHPRMARMVADRVEQLRSQGTEVVVLEAALLFEAGWDSLVDEVWVIDAPVEVLFLRLRARNDLDEAEVQKRIGAQMARGDRRSRADVVVDNSGDIAALRETVSKLWHTRVLGRIERK